MSKQNPNSSTFVQVLLDAKVVAEEENLSVLASLITQILAFIQGKNSLISKVDTLFKRHNYPTNHIVFAKVKNIKSNEIIRYLSPTACKILLIAISGMCEFNNVELKKDTICDMFNVPRRTFSDAIKELEEYGCITCILRRNKEHGNIYMVNSEIAEIGKGIPFSVYKNETPETCLEAFADATGENKIISVSRHSIPRNEEIIHYNSFVYNSTI